VPLNPSFSTKQVVAALDHLSAGHLVLGLETNLPRRPPRSNIPLLKELAPSFESARVLESELVPSLRNVVVVDNSNGSGSKGRFAAFSNFSDVLAHGAGKEHLSEDGMTPDDVVNIQFTSGCVGDMQLGGE
jgi:hypothetical protein